jgi:hypothetical protein
MPSNLLQQILECADNEAIAKWRRTGDAEVIRTFRKHPSVEGIYLLVTTHAGICIAPNFVTPQDMKEAGLRMLSGKYRAYRLATFETPLGPNIVYVTPPVRAALTEDDWLDLHVATMDSFALRNPNAPSGTCL